MIEERPGSTSSLRRRNSAQVLQAVRQAGGLTQAEIARRSGLSPATVTNLVRDLAAAGQVEVAATVLNGRRSRLVTPVVPSGYVLGVDVGRSHIRAGLADLGLDLVAQGDRRMEPGLPAEQGLELVGQLYQEVLERAGVDRGEVLWAGVGVPGPLDQASQQIGAGTMLPEWTGQDLRSRFARLLGLPVAVDNDANLGALGEHAWPPGLSVRSMIYVRLATGIGGGLILDGRLYRGADGVAGEIGHATIDENGPLCRCGNRGCLETMASIPSLLRVLASALDREVDVHGWVGLVRQGHTTANRLIDELGHHLGVAVSNLCNLVNPSLVLLGGPIAAAGEALLEPVRSEVRRRSMPSAYDRLRVEASRHGEMSEVYGAARLALDALTERMSAQGEDLSQAPATAGRGSGWTNS
ncbi:MAG: ROK family transcriptional regulator [Propionibacteriaceae bacterium]|nr:ROK family transcriptional regulator [Propionibacteriaceae bacterium]